MELSELQSAMIAAVKARYRGQKEQIMKSVMPVFKCKTDAKPVQKVADMLMLC